MNEPTNEQLGVPHLIAGPPNKRTQAQGLLIPIIVGAATAVSILSVAFGVWALNQSQRNPPTAQQQDLPAQMHDETSAERKATQRFWTAIIQADEKTLPVVKAAFDTYNPSEKTEVALPKLCQLADVVSIECSKWSSEVKKLDVLQVDEDLLNHVREEIRINDKVVGGFNGLAETSVAFYQWQKKKSAPPGNILGDMLDSFFQGMMGRPFAGYEKFQANAAKVDAEGQLLIDKYLAHCKSLASSFEESGDHSIKEHQLRSGLSKKYGVEFAPRPE